MKFPLSKFEPVNEEIEILLLVFLKFLSKISYFFFSIITLSPSSKKIIFCVKGASAKESEPIKVDVSDIRSVTVGMLLNLKKELSKSIKKYSDPNMKNHLT